MAKIQISNRVIHYDWHNQPQLLTLEDGSVIKLKSKQEFKYAKYLQLLKLGGEIEEWKYEPTTFEFVIRWGKIRTYTPDFKVIEKDGTVRWHEVKTSLRQKDVLRFKLMNWDFPEERLVLIITSKPKRIIKQKRLLANAMKYVEEVIFVGPIFRKLGF